MIAAFRRAFSAAGCTQVRVREYATRRGRSVSVFAIDAAGEELHARYVILRQPPDPLAFVAQLAREIPI